MAKKKVVARRRASRRRAVNTNGLVQYQLDREAEDIRGRSAKRFDDLMDISRKVSEIRDWCRLDVSTREGQRPIGDVGFYRWCKGEFGWSQPDVVKICRLHVLYGNTLHDHKHLCRTENLMYLARETGTPEVIKAFEDKRVMYIAFINDNNAAGLNATRWEIWHNSTATTQCGVVYFGEEEIYRVKLDLDVTPEDFKATWEQRLSSCTEHWRVETYVPSRRARKVKSSITLGV